MKHLNDSLESLRGKNLFIGSGVPSIQLLVGMRDLGYTNIQTFADLIDNCIDAIAKDGTGIIKIVTNFDDKDENNSFIITDNGCGMSLETLSSALIFGGEKDREYLDLGKFKYGLKTASLAMGRRVKVITKAENEKHYTGIFDYDEAMERKEWDFQIVIESPEEDIEFFKETVGDNTGTIVIVSKLDRLDYNSADKNKKHLDNKIKKNIGEIFRNFISTSSDDDKIKFFYNGKLVVPIDPMCRDLQHSHDFKVFNPNDGEYEVEVSGKKYHFKVICYHVPTIQAEDKESFNGMRHTSPSNSGFYILRNNRQIQRASWDIFNVKTDEDVKVRHSTGNSFRGELFYNSDCDEIFKTDTKKMTIRLPQEVVDKINLEVWTYLRGVQKLHSHGYKKKSPGEVMKDLQYIQAKMNNKVSTPTVLKNKNEQPITPTKPPVVPKVSGNKRKTHSRNENRKVEFNEFDGETTGSLINIEKEGIKKYVISFNRNHVFYDRFSELDVKSKEFVVHILHGIALTLYSELYDTFSGRDKTLLIDEFIEKFSNFLRKDSQE